MADSKEAGLPLLHEEGGHACECQALSSRQYKSYTGWKGRWFSWASLLAVYASLVSLWIALHLSRISSIPKIGLPEKAAAATSGLDFVPTLYSPLDGALSYTIERTKPNSWDPALFFGNPNYASDYAWENLLGARGYQISVEEAAQLHINDSIKLSPGTNYATLLGVTHNLHCLRRIRQTLYRDYYYANQTEEFWDEDWFHNLHCLETIRQSLMCYPDLNPYPYYWSNSKFHPISVSPEVTRQCVDWDALQEKVNDRAFRFRDMMRNTGPLMPSM